MKIQDFNDHVKKIIGFQRKIKDFNDNLKKIIDFSKENLQFPITAAGGSLR